MKNHGLSRLVRDQEDILTNKEKMMANEIGWKPVELPKDMIFSVSGNRVVSFYNRNGKIIGEIDYNKTGIIFEGDMHSTAEALFNFVNDILEPLYKKK